MTISLSQALFLPVGRATLMNEDTEATLLGAHGSLCNRFRILCSKTEEATRTLMRLPQDLFPRTWSRWTLLTEHEHHTWPVTAVSRPPVLETVQTAAYIQHLLSARAPMSPREVQQSWQNGWIEATADTWGGLLAHELHKQTSRMLLPCWGMLSDYIAAYESPSLLPYLHQLSLHDIDALARFVLWHELTPLHGGLDTPEKAESLVMALQIWSQTPPDETEKPSLLPYPQVAHRLEQHNVPRAREVAGQLFHQLKEHPYNPHGLALRQEAGSCLYWLRKGPEIFVISCQFAEEYHIKTLIWTIE